MILFFFISFSELHAETPEKSVNKGEWVPEVAETRQDIESSKSVIKEIKLKEPFVNIQQKRIWSFFDDDEEFEDEAEASDNAWFSDLIEFIAILIEAALWLVPVFVALYLYRYRDYCINLLKGRRFGADESNVPDSLFGLDVSEKNLPDNIEEYALKLWHQKMYREAVSLLYRGALVSMFKQYRFNLSVGATEHECVRQIDRIHIPSTDNVYDIQRIEHFKQLTKVWIEVAYAHRIPAESVFESVSTGWNKLFADAGGKS